VAFTLDVPASAVAADGANELFVLADNRFNHTTAPMHTGGDFWHYGGLMRSVELHSLPAAGQAWPWRAYVLPASISTVNISIILTDANFSGEVDMALSFDDGTVSKIKTTASAGRITLARIPVPNPRVWTTTDPQLHTAQVGRTL